MSALCVSVCGSSLGPDTPPSASVDTQSRAPQHPHAGMTTDHNLHTHTHTHAHAHTHAHTHTSAYTHTHTHNHTPHTAHTTPPTHPHAPTQGVCPKLDQWTISHPVQISSLIVPPHCKYQKAETTTITHLSVCVCLCVCVCVCVCTRS